MFTNYLIFSDAAKYALIAKNLLMSGNFCTDFVFFTQNVNSLLRGCGDTAALIPPIYPVYLSLIFKLIGVSDYAVKIASLIPFVGLLIVTFMLGKKLFGKIVGGLSFLVVLFNQNFIDYATSGGTETLFTFEIMITVYLLTFKNKVLNIVSLILMILMYFTRPTAFIYILGLLLFFILLNNNIKKSIIIFFLTSLVWIIVDYFVFPLFKNKLFIYSVTNRAQFVVTYIVSGISSSESLRGNLSQSFNLVNFAKKVFYNLYNLYRLLPQIASPYLIGLYILSIFSWSGNKLTNSFKMSSIFIVISTFMVAAASIPLFRYLHPVVPIMYICALGFMVEIMRKYMFSFNLFGKCFSKNTLLLFASLLIVGFFVIGQTLGVVFLDTRFEAKNTNLNMPPIYEKLSTILRDNTNPKDVILTNLDTWGSWYGERKTVWFPLTPEMIYPTSTNSFSFDAIYLTNYLIDDENYFMGSEWRQIYNEPTNIKDEYIAKNYKLKGIYEILPKENYQNISGRGVLLVRK